MTRPDRRRLCWLMMTILAATTAISASLASAQSDPASSRAANAAAEVGMPTPALRAVPSAEPAVPPTHRETLDDCMRYWDSQTHMSRGEWLAACRRTLNGTDMN
jgi:hypothetical protein